jgi:hypothetical protein
MKNRMMLIMATSTTLWALAVVSASSASAALPEFLPVGTKANFASTSGVGVLENIKKEIVLSCTSDTNSGEITGAKTIRATIFLVGCKGLLFANCTTTGAKAGEVVVDATGTLGFIQAVAPLVIGVLLALDPFEYSCAAGLLKVKVRGSVIGEITPINVATATARLIFKQKAGVQEFTKFAGAAADSLETSKNGAAFEASGLETDDELFFTEKITIDG